MEFTGERLVPGEAGWQMDLEHFARYSACRPLCAGRRVLDAACGTGYGSKLLAEVALSVSGVDVDSETIDFAQRTYAASNVSFTMASVTSLPFDDDSFDVLVSFETYEHVDKDSQSRLLDESRRVLGEQGVLAISTPDRRVSERRGSKNEYHAHEVCEAVFVEELESRFEHVCVYRQNTWVYNEILPVKCGGVSVSVEPVRTLPEGQNVIALCSDAATPPSIGGLVRGPSGYDDLIAGRTRECELDWTAECERTRRHYEESLSWRITEPMRRVHRIMDGHRDD